MQASRRRSRVLTVSPLLWAERRCARFCAWAHNAENVWLGGAAPKCRESEEMCDAATVR